MRRRGLPLLLACSALAVAGCSAPAGPPGAAEQPKVTFYSQGHSAAVRPVSHCNVIAKNCSPANPAAPTSLHMPPDRPIQISVDTSIAQTPWQVAFRYRNQDGHVVQGRSEVFSPGDRYAYTLRLPPEATSVESLEVQQFAAALIATPNGGVDFATRGSWVVRSAPEPDRS